MANTFWLLNNKLTLTNNKVMYCAECPCGDKNWYICGKCTVAGQELYIEQSDDPSTITSGYVLDGPYRQTKAQQLLNDPTKVESYKADLKEKCSGNSCTMVLGLVLTSGTDLDIYVEIITEVYGYGHICDKAGTYGHHYGDNTSNNGSEKVSINRANVMSYCQSKSIETIDVNIYAHWWSSKGDGKVTLTYTSSTQIIKSEAVVDKQSSTTSKANYSFVNTLVYNPFTDTFTIKTTI